MQRRASAPADAGLTPDEAVDIDALLRASGYDTPAAIEQARAVLVAAKLTRAGKRAIVSRKGAAILRALAASLVRACSDECAGLAPASSRRRPVRVSSRQCEICQGSNNRRAALACGHALRRAGLQRLLVVGGSAPQQHELAALLRVARVEPQFVDGTRSQNQKEALANMRRVELVVIWGGTPLRHAVSNLYASPPQGVQTVTVPRRGIEALCREVIRACEKRR